MIRYYIDKNQNRTNPADGETAAFNKTVFLYLLSDLVMRDLSQMVLNLFPSVPQKADRQRER